jgi:D-glycero-alpha-D-manno-heptose 1-phosphate guanylyltransferase
MSEDTPVSGDVAMLTAGDITAVILAGGIGSRLRKVTATPKPIVPVDGKPFVVHLLDALKAKGVCRAVVCTGYEAQQVERIVREGNPGLALTFSAETSPLGTAGALRLAAARAETRHVLAMNGDSWCDFSLEALLDFQRTHPDRPTLIATHVPESGRFGQLELEDAGRILGFREKGASSSPGWINAGLYLLPTAMLRELPGQAPLSLEKDVMPGWIKGGLYAFRSEGAFLDIGTPESFARKETFVRLMIEARKARALAPLPPR